MNEVFKKISIFVKRIFFAGLILATLGCPQSPSKPCDLNCWRNIYIWLYLPYIQRSLSKCGADYTLEPGDTVDFTIPKESNQVGLYYRACSQSDWVFKVTPPIDGKVAIYLNSKTGGSEYCKDGELLIKSSTAGKSVSLFGGAGCVARNEQNAIRVFGLGPSGSNFHIEFN